MKLKLLLLPSNKTADIELDPRDPDSNIESLLVLASAEFEIDTGLLHLNYKNQQIFNPTTATPATSQTPLTRLNLSEGDTIQVSTYPLVQNNNNNNNNQHQHATTATPISTTTTTASAADQELLRLFGNPAPQQQQQQQQQQRPAAVAAAPSANADQELLRLFGQGLAQQQQQRSQQHQQMGPRVNSDDPEYQRKILEAIQRQNIEENLQNAMEHTPEAFARVTMLYVPCEVNHNKMVAFIDSGAQMTVMSEETAEQCSISHLIDRRYAGMAHGVGTTKIVGRVHLTMVQVAGQVLPMSITILAAKNMDFLIGLDQLKRHQMLVDLKNNELRIDETHAVKFLGEGELPEHLKDGIPRHASSGAPDLEAIEEDKNKNKNENKKNEDAAAATTTTTTTNSAPQRRPSPQPSSLGTAGAVSSMAANLTEEQRNSVKELAAAFGVSEAAALQALKSADWNAELAANLILSMTS